MVENYRHIEQLESYIYGEGSLLKLFADNYGLHFLVQDITVTVIDDPAFCVYATIDPDDGNSHMIVINWGTYRTISRLARKAVDILAVKDEKPWVSFGFSTHEFKSRKAFADYLSRIMLDFILMHELGHIIRGHIDYIFGLTNKPLQESDQPELRVLDVKRITLELDADNIALYHFITCSEFMMSESPIYGKINDFPTFIKVLGFATKMVFAILTESNPKANPTSSESLIKYHQDATHPHPAAREEFATQMILQLASGNKSRKLFQKYLDESGTLFFSLIANNLFSLFSMESWLRNPAEVAEFLNIYIDEIQYAEQQGWIANDTRLMKAFDAMSKII